MPCDEQDHVGMEVRQGLGDQIRAHEERDEAWKKLVRYLIDEGGFAPPYGARGQWVDLYDEVTAPAQRDGLDA